MHLSSIGEHSNIQKPTLQKNSETKESKNFLSGLLQSLLPDKEIDQATGQHIIGIG